MDTLTIPEINFQAFCGSKENRFKIDQPYVMNGWKCATNARIFIRVPSIESTTPFIDRPSPSPDALFKPFDWVNCDGDSRPFPLHNGEYSVERRCPDCKGRGKETIGYVCRNCQWDGEVQSKHPCEECAGTGKTWDDMEINGRLCAGKYIRLINAQLPNARIPLHCVKPDCNHNDKLPLPFIFDGGGQGLLMPTQPCT